MKKELFIKEGLMLRNIANSYVVVAVGKASKDFNGMINLNETGAFLWEALSKVHSKEELVNELLKEYDIDFDQANNDVEEFLEVLEKNEFLK